MEAVADEKCYPMLMEGLRKEADGLVFYAKLPPEMKLPFAKTERKQKGVMGLCNASALLQALQLELPYAFRLTDIVIPENTVYLIFEGSLPRKLLFLKFPQGTCYRFWWDIIPLLK